MSQIDPKLIHFVYKTTDIRTGEFYIGRHSTKKVKDSYKGSGLWILNHLHPHILNREILFFLEDFISLCSKEEEIIRENKSNILCKNRNDKSCGFASGELNPNCKPEARERLRERVAGSKNPMFGKTHSEETKKHISETMQGESNPFFGKTHTKESKESIRQKATGRKASNETKQKLSKMRRGKIPKCNFIGKVHTDETKLKMSNARKEYWKNKKI